MSLDDLLYVDEGMQDDVIFEAADRASEREATACENRDESSAKEAPTDDEVPNTENPSKVRIGVGGIHVEDGAEKVQYFLARRNSRNRWREGRRGACRVEWRACEKPQERPG